MMNSMIHALASIAVSTSVSGVMADDISGQVSHGYADSSGVKIHYAEIGEGPLVVMIHGFPDFWYSWRHQMTGLADGYRVVAIDQRGYNLSDQPDGIEAYDMSLLVRDVAAVIHHLGEESAVIVGHDWGGVVAWNFAFHLPQMTEFLVLLNLPHPNGLANAWKNSPEALAGTAYAKVFKEGSPSDPEVFFGMPMTAETLSGWVTDPSARQAYVEALGRSSFDGMLAYYKRNYPDPWDDDFELGPSAPSVTVPTLMIHGLNDSALHSDALNNTWDWIDEDFTLVTIPDAGHFVQQDAAAFVTTTLRGWLDQRMK